MLWVAAYEPNPLTQSLAFSDSENISATSPRFGATRAAKPSIKGWFAHDRHFVC